jgi:hypothetical protein
MNRRALLLCLPLLVGCVPSGGSIPKDDSAVIDGVLVFEPDSLDFGVVLVGELVEATLSLSNRAGEPVDISALVVEGAGFTLLDAPELPIELGAGATLELGMGYEPVDESMHGGVLIATPAAGEVSTAVLTGMGLLPEQVVDEVQLSEPAVDFLFLADRGGSMTDDLVSLALAFPDFVAQLNGITADWQITVVNADDGCRGWGVISPASGDLAAQFERALLKLGGEDSERLLGIASLAVQQSGAGECNDGSLRDDASLHVVAVSDEPERSVEPWSTLVADIQGAKPFSQQVRISAIAGDYPSGCGEASAGTGYYEASEATEGAFLSICDSWEDNAIALAKASAWLWRVDLSATPQPDSIQLTVDGEERSEGWHYDEAENAVLFDWDYPEPEVLVRVEYSSAG